MARISTGPKVKQRSQQIFATLLDYANHNLPVLETQETPQRQAIELKWLTDTELIVKTKLRYLQTLTAQAHEGSALTIAQIRESLNRLQDHLGILKDHRVMTQGSETWHFSLHFWYPRQARSANLERFNTEWDQHRQHGSIVPALKSEPTSICRQDWGEAPDVSQFYGRTEELSILKQWILGDRCRLVAILGMGGIGKSALSTKLAQVIQSEFEVVIWRSLRNAPSLELLLGELVPLLSPQQESEPTHQNLLRCLQNTRCLVILDNMETILQSGLTGYYRRGYEEYGELLRIVGESRHQSCVVLTSREKPPEVGQFEGNKKAVRSLSLEGALDIALELVEAVGLTGTMEQREVLCKHYGCSPLALKIVASAICDLFAGDTAQFFAEEVTVFNGIRRLLDQQFGRLSELERNLMYWLAINRDWTSLSELAVDMIPKVSKSRLLESLESLCWRSLIEKQTGKYTQQPVVMEYITAQLVETITSELRNLALDKFSRLALIKATAQDFIRSSQKRLLLGPITDQLTQTYVAPSALKVFIQQVLQELRKTELGKGSYGAGNLLNLAIHIEVDLSDYDFSQLSIWQAYLQDVQLRRVCFRDAVFAQSLFTKSFGNPLTVALSRDGQFLALGDINGNIEIWTSQGQPIKILSGHQSSVYSVAWNTNGTLLASGSDDQTIRVWERQSGRCIATFFRHQNAVRSLDWHPYQNLLVSSSDDHTIRVWDVEIEQCLAVLEGHRNSIRSVAWNSDGSLLISAAVDCTLKVWDAENHRCLKTIPTHGYAPRTIAVHPRQALWITGNDDHTVRVWNYQGECVKVLSGHNSLVMSVDWSPDGNWIVSSSDDGTIRIWRFDNGQCVRTLSGHHHSIWSISWGPLNDKTPSSISAPLELSKTVIASGSHDQTVKLWNPANGNCIRTLQGHTNSQRDVSWNLPGTHLASVTHSRQLKLWNISTGETLYTPIAQGETAWNVAWNPSESHCELLAVSNDSIQIWNTNTGECRHTLKGHQNWIWWIAWSPDGKKIASASDDHTVRVWDLATGQCLQILAEHHGWVRSLAWSGDGQKLASGSDDHTIRVWDISTGVCQSLFTGHTNAIRSLSWNPHNTLLVSGSYDQTLRVWDTEQAKCVQTITTPTYPIWAVAWNPNGTCFAAAGAHTKVSIWSPEQAQELDCYDHSSLISAIAWHPNGMILASCGGDRTIKLWQQHTSDCIQTISDGPYDGMDITGASGINKVQKSTLVMLGAVDHESEKSVENLENSWERNYITAIE